MNKQNVPIFPFAKFLVADVITIYVHGKNWQVIRYFLMAAV
jgi:hypothetical protein